MDDMNPAVARRVLLAANNEARERALEKVDRLAAGDDLDTFGHALQRALTENA